MRPLLVLILVIAALGGFWLALDLGQPASSPSTGLDPGGVPGPTSTSVDPDAAETLVPTERDRTEAEGLVPIQEPGSPSSVAVYGTAVYGQVIDPAGDPVANAEVVLARGGVLMFADSHDPADDRIERTNVQGRFRFDSVAPFESYTVIARHPSFGRNEESEVNVTEDEQVLVKLTLGGSLRLFGVIRDGSGLGVADARLELTEAILGLGASGADALSATTNASGTYEFPTLAQGNYTLKVSADGYGTVLVPQLNVTADVERNVELDVAQMIGGRITSEITGEPVPDALVQAFLNARGRDTTRTQTRTDEDGDFLLQDVRAGSYVLLVRADGFKAYREQRVDAGDMTVSIALTPNPTVQGVVVSAASGQPLRHFTVRLRQEVPNSGVSAPFQKTRKHIDDDQGRFALTCPRPGEYMVEARSAGHPACFSAKFTVSESQNLDGIRVVMTVGGSITGRVVDLEGHPVAGASVTSRDTDWSDDMFMRSLGEQYPTHASTNKGRTNSEGLFVLAPLTPSTYLVEIKHKGFSTKYQREILVTEGLETKVHDLVVTRGASVSGTVIGPSGAPVAGARVELAMDSLAGANDYAAHFNTKTNQKGQYSFKHVTPGVYFMFAQRPQRPNSGNPFLVHLDRNATQRKLTLNDSASLQGIDFNLSD